MRAEDYRKRHQRRSGCMDGTKSERMHMHMRMHTQTHSIAFERAHLVCSIVQHLALLPELGHNVLQSALGFSDLCGRSRLSTGVYGGVTFAFVHHATIVLR
jgi:hypothetical protein